MSMIKKGLIYSSTSFLIGSHVLFPELTTMPSFDANAFAMLIALAMATLALVITIGVLPVVRVVSVVRVPSAPSRAGRRQVEA